MSQPRKKPKAPPRRRDVVPLELLEEAARKFRALGVPSRLQILSALMSGPRAMGELAGETGLGQSNLSRQVRELEIAGCVTRTKVGRSVEVELSDPTLRRICELVCHSLEQRISDGRAALGRLQLNRTRG